MSDDHRNKIANSKILNTLIRHACGETRTRTKLDANGHKVSLEVPLLSASQVTAGLGLMRKILPDLTAVTVEGGVEVSRVAHLPEPMNSMTDWQKNYGQAANANEPPAEPQVAKKNGTNGNGGSH